MAGTSLHVDEEGDGARVVLVHGFTQTGQSWGPVADDLARDHRVVRVDAPGHGGSAGVSADLWVGARLVGRAGGAATYIGYSMGARLCLHLALAAPSLIRALVVIGATGGIDDDAERSARRAGDEALARRLEEQGLEAFLQWWLAQPLFAGLPADAAGLRARRANTVAGLADSLRRAGTGTQEPPLWNRLGELSMPVLAVAGERDAKFRPLAERLAAAIGDNASVAVVPGGGHAAHLEAPDAFIAIVRPFLAASG